MTARHVKARLMPLGFKKSGVHFYLHKSPNILVFHKKTFRSMFEGFYLAMTHDFFRNTRDGKGNIKVPSNLENFPFSIPLLELKYQYRKHQSVLKFTYDTNFITRETLPTRKHTKRM